MEKLLAAVAQTHGFDDDAPVQPAARMENSGGADGENGGSKCPAGVQPIVIVHNPPPEAVLRRRRKRKRVRPAVVQPVASRTPPPPPPPSKRMKQEMEEENVCFICLDGGSLVLCDRKGCPKAYHPACVKRDEAFFSMKAKWTCGWHICSVCQKGSYYMCYTCTYSLCKGCIKDSDFSCVRGDKGFCSTCMKMIMLIENEDQASNESVQVDFDDKMSWEYLLKVYWVILKEKLSLTMSELIKARKPSKGAVDWPEAEISRHDNLQDRASENENQNELREYVDKLQILQSPEDRQRRNYEVPEIHSDLRQVSPYSRNQVNSRKGSSVGTKSKRGRGRPRKARKSASPNKKVVSNEERRTTRSQSRQMEAADGLNNSDKQVNQVSNNTSGSAGANHAVQGSGLETMVATDSAAKSPSANHIETENLWHYRDPNGKIQGPFSMMQLRKWNTTGLFPSDMRIWTNHEQYDSVLLTDALNGHFHGASEVSCQPSLVLQENGTGIGVSEVKDANVTTTTDSNHAEAALSNPVNILSENNTGPAREDVSGSSWWPPCWNSIKDMNVDSDDVQAHKMPPPSSCGQTDVLPSQVPENNEFNHGEQSSKSPNSDKQAEDLLSTGPDFMTVSKSPKSGKQAGDIDVFDLLSTFPKTVDSQQSIPSNGPIRESSILEFLDLTPRLNNEDHGGGGTETKQSAGINFPVPDSGPSWSSASTTTVGGIQLSAWNLDTAFPSSSVKHPQCSSENVDTLTIDGFQLTNVSSSHARNWMSILDEPIKAFGEDSISALLAQVDALESQKKSLPLSTSELIEDCKDECFSSIEDFSSVTEPQKIDGLSSSGEVQLTSQSSSQTLDVVDSMKRSSVNSSGSSEGETNAPAYDTGFAVNQDNMFGGNAMETGRGGMAWMEQNINNSPAIVWDNQRRACYQGNSELPWVRQPIVSSSSSSVVGATGGYSPNGQRVCKFYESGHCKKGAFCDYVHHH